MGQLDGKVAYITGAARGQGRSHAVRLAAEGADIVAIDVCAQLDSVTIPLAAEAELEETAELVRAQGRRIITQVGDVRKIGDLRALAAKAMKEFGRLDIVCANAGVWAIDSAVDDRSEAKREGIWNVTIDTDLMGVWNTLDATVPYMREAGNGGSIMITGSVASVEGQPPFDDLGTCIHAAQVSYVAARHAVVGLVRCYAPTLAAENIRVNCIAPTGVNTLMSQNAIVEDLAGKFPELTSFFANRMPVGLIEPNDVSDTVVFLSSDAARYVTGTFLPVDAGKTVR